VPLAAGIWFLGSTLIALFAGGFVAGRLAGVIRFAEGALHGVLAWALATLMTAYFFTSAVGSAIGAIGSAAGAGMSAAANAVGAAVPQQQADQAAKDTGQAISGIANRIAQRGNANVTPEDRNAALDAVAQRTGKTREEVQAIQQQTQQKFDEMKATAAQKARVVGNDAARGVAKASLWTFGALLLGGLASALGGRIGASRARVTAQRSAEFH